MVYFLSTRSIYRFVCIKYINLRRSIAVTMAHLRFLFQAQYGLFLKATGNEWKADIICNTQIQAQLRLAMAISMQILSTYVCAKCLECVDIFNDKCNNVP